MNGTIKKLLVVSAGVICGCCLVGFWPMIAGHASANSPRVLFYQDSMHPWVKSDKPGKCTVCAMDLTAIYEGQQGFGSADTVLLHSNAITVANVRTEEVARKPLTRILKVAGTIEASEARKAILAAPAMGRVDQLLVESTGIEVTNGQPLVTFYSPSWSTRRLYLQSRTAAPRGAVAGSSEMDMAPGQAVHPNMSEPGAAPDGRSRQGSNFYIDLMSPQDGVILERPVFKGQYVQEGEKILVLADPSMLWFRFDAYEQQLPWLEVGQKIELTIASLPGQVFTATIGFIEAALNDATRTVRVRADIANPFVERNGRLQRLLKFGMYADGRVEVKSAAVLSVSRDAVLFPGGQAYAFVDKGDGAYQKRQLRLGRQGDGRWEVLSGLDAGERVVMAGNVLIDAQSQFNESGESAEAVEMAQAAVPHSETMGKETDEQTPPPGASAKSQAAPAPKGRATNTFAARLNQRQLTPPVRTSEELVVPDLTDEQKKALDDFLGFSGVVSEALAADDLGAYNREFAKLPAVTSMLDKAFPASHPWHAIVQHFGVLGKAGPAKDLATARRTFLIFSTNAAEVAKRARRENAAPATLKLYHCPMAPKPGLWVQTNGPLHNPFFGLKMLSCGEEVKP